MVSEPLAEFLRRHTTVSTPEICPEIRLHLSTDLNRAWDQLEASSLPHAGTPPFWSVAWIGGQALARYTLDHSALFRNRSVLDLGSGSGLCAIAAAMAGASSVEASDIDPIARDVIAVNAEMNEAEITVWGDVAFESASRWDVILAADLWYERFASQRLSAWLQSRADEGTRVFMGDCGRAFFPRNRAKEACRYVIGASEQLERYAKGDVQVWVL